jgi:F420-0:gamma-glutamyl ligase
MNFIKIKTRAILPPKDAIYPILDTYVPKLKEGDVVFITSKILAIHQGRCLLNGDVKDKDALIVSESDRYIPRSEVPHGYAVLTLKDYTLIPSAGIDESNANGHYILWSTESARGSLPMKHM